jgi:hypothetical protein
VAHTRELLACGGAASRGAHAGVFAFLAGVSDATANLPLTACARSAQRSSKQKHGKPVAARRWLYSFVAIFHYMIDSPPRVKNQASVDERRF